jgi:signal transduction histidine kinase
MTEPSPLPGLVRILCDLRLAMVALAVVAESLTTRSVTAMLALVVALPLSYVPLRRWEAVAPRIRRMPLLVVLDVAYATTLLLLVNLPELMLLYALSTVLLGGLVFGRVGAWVSGGLMATLLLTAAGVTAVLGYATVEAVVTLSGYALLYAIAALGTARLNDLFSDYLRATEQARADSRRAAHAEERARLAREMHDRVSKTVHGMRLLAVSLRGRLRGGDAAGAANDAEHLVEAAELATNDARRLLQDLRTDTPDASLVEALQDALVRWSERTGLTGRLVAADPDVALGVGTRYELLCVLGEVLENVHRHAGATARVEVTLGVEDDWACLEVTDDGDGFDVPDDVRDLGACGHYGLVGIHERAARVGGILEVRSRRGEGTRVRLRAPTALPADDDPRPDVAPAPVSNPSPAGPRQALA